MTAVPVSVGGGPEWAARRGALERRVRLLVAVTISYNVVEGVVAISAGIGASSAALVGFGLDSAIEVASATAVAWQFAGRDPETRERTALRIIAISFFALASYVAVEAVRAIIGASEAEHSTVGLVLAGLSLAVMPGLSWAQRKAGRELGSATAVADSKQTLLCTYLSAVLLVGLALNSLFGWSWADPIAALVIAAIAVREGREAWRGENCCAPTGPGSGTSADACDEGCCDDPAPAGSTPVAMGVKRDRREALGQIVRLVVAAPGSASGRYPEGNTGRASVGLRQPMPMPDDLVDLLTS